MLEKKIKVVLASSNKGKIEELNALLADFSIELIPQSEFGIEDADETGLTFIENALIKARHATKLSGLPAIADDSGIVVKALNGAPGVYSARYAGEHGNAQENIKKLLVDLKDVPTENREAAFHCTLAFIINETDPTPIVCEGEWPGSILFAPQGDQGFGYDPVFYVPSEDKSVAELSADIKNKMSHRGIALQALLKRLPEKL